MPIEMFDFVNARGSRLSGKIKEPKVTPLGRALLAYCFTCGKDSLAAVRVSRALDRVGSGVLRFDFAGLGDSEGDFADAKFSADVDDLAMAAYAMGEAAKPVSLLVGLSLGGAAAIAAAARIPGITGIATIAAPAGVQHVLYQFELAALDRALADGEADVLLGARPFHIRCSFIDDIARRNMEKSVASLRRPLLVMRAPLAALVGIDHGPPSSRCLSQTGY
jgi:uncharacterized protein